MVGPYRLDGRKLGMSPVDKDPVNKPQQPSTKGTQPRSYHGGNDRRRAPGKYAPFNSQNP